jgi:histone H3/H4
MTQRKIHPIVEFSNYEIAHMIQTVFFDNYGENKWSSSRSHMFKRLRLSGLVYEEVRSILVTYFEYVTQKLTTKIVTEHDALQIVSFVPGMTPRLKKCAKMSIQVEKLDDELKRVTDTLAELSKKIENSLESGRPVATINKFRDEIETLANSKTQLYESYQTAIKEQKDADSSCFHLSHLKVRRVLEFIADGAFTFTDDACLVLQFDVECRLTRLFTNAFRVLYHAKRETMMPKDLALTRAVMFTEKLLRRPRLEFPEVSFSKEYVQIRDAMGIDEKKVSPSLVKQLDRFCHLLIALVVDYANLHERREKPSIIKRAHVAAAVHAILPSELSKYAKVQTQRMDEGNNPPIFDIQIDLTIDPDAARLLNQVVEYVTAELIDLMQGLHSSSSFHSQFENDEELSILKNNLEFVVVK